MKHNQCKIYMNQNHCIYGAVQVSFTGVHFVIPLCLNLLRHLVCQFCQNRIFWSQRNWNFRIVAKRGSQLQVISKVKYMQSESDIQIQHEIIVKMCCPVCVANECDSSVINVFFHAGGISSFMQKTLSANVKMTSWDICQKN